MTSNLAVKMEDWVMSSFRDYAGLRNGTLYNQKLARELLDISGEPGNLYEEANKIIIEKFLYPSHDRGVNIHTMTQSHRMNTQLFQVIGATDWPERV